MMTAKAVSSPFFVASMRAWSDRSSDTRWFCTSDRPDSILSNAIHSYFLQQFAIRTKPAYLSETRSPPAKVAKGGGCTSILHLDRPYRRDQEKCPPRLSSTYFSV